MSARSASSIAFGLCLVGPWLVGLCLLGCTNDFGKYRYDPDDASAPGAAPAGGAGSSPTGNGGEPGAGGTGTTNVGATSATGGAMPFATPDGGVPSTEPSQGGAPEAP